MVSSEALANSINSDKSKAISIGMVMQVDVGNVNAGWTEGVVTVDLLRN